MPSIKDVAQQAGVSVTTVSLVLNSKGNISDETRDKVLQVVRDLGYTRSIQARNLRDRQSRIIGFAQAQTRNEFNPILNHFLYEMVRYVEASHRHVLMFTADADNVDIYQNLYESQRVDGFVLSYTVKDDPRFVHLHEAGVPFVAFGRSLSPIDSHTHWVDVDGTAGAYDATQHLLYLGHRRIGVVAWPEGSASGDSRVSGWRQAMQDATGNTPHADYIARALDGVQNGYAAAKQLLALDEPPTAIVALSDILAAGVLRYTAEHRLRIAVTGFDDNPIAEFMHPQLTSVRQPIEAVARLAVDMLLRQLEGEEIEAKQHLLLPELIIRESSLLND